MNIIHGSALIFGFILLTNGQNEVWKTFEGRFYGHFEQPKTFFKALEVCQNIDGIIAPVRTQQESQFLIQLRSEIGESTKRRWIGGTDKNRDDGSYIWLDDSPITWSNWNRGELYIYSGSGDEPINAGGKEDCMVMEANGKWNDIDCDLFEHKYFCMIANSPIGWTSFFPGKEFRFFDLHQHTYSEVKNMCRSFNGEIPSPDTNLSILNALRYRIKSVDSNETNPVWIKSDQSNNQCSFVGADEVKISSRSCSDKINFICVRNKEMPPIRSEPVEPSTFPIFNTFNERDRRGFGFVTVAALNLV
ncbi:macrophage mannose receptor 1 [Patella vulgata]|uniref:macrophage mannose receptor 1 n=1 Tax=Patella vulgata TaxID=6465 RepID=UPI00217F2AA4|nr:macrophage mannose receptor 1 [Patella vulgata]